MTTLAADMDATQGYIPQIDVSPGFYTLGSELIRVSSERTADRSERGGGQFDSMGTVVSRGIAGTSAAAHSAGVSFVSIQDPSTGGGSGGVTVDNGSDPPAAVTTLVSAGADVSTPGSATIRSTVISDTNPGAIGAGNFWIETDPTENLAQVQLHVRNAADDGFIEIGLASFVGNSGSQVWQQFSAVEPDELKAEIRLASNDSGHGGRIELYTEGEDGDVFADAEFRNESLRITSKDNVNTTQVILVPTGLTLVSIAGAGGGLVLSSLPTSDPGVVGKVYSDGVASAGVPKPLMVSGG